MSQGIHLRKYGVETKIPFELYEIDGVDLRTDAADAGSDCSIMKDEGAEATCTNDFVDEGMGYSITLTSTEMEAARVVIYVVDSAAKVWLDKVIIVETYGNASAQHALDLDDAVRGGMTALPNAAADAAGGLPISDAGGLDIDTKLANTNEVTAARMGALTDWIDGGRLDLLLDAIPTTAMRGTDSAALASVVGALNDAAAAGEVTEADTLVQYLKQLINILIGTPGIGTFPAGAAPGNAVSLAEVIRAIHVDVTGLNGDAMRGTDGANTTVPDAAGTAPTAVENRQEMDSNSTELAKIGTIPALDGAGQTIGAAIAKLADDNGGANFDATNDSLERIANTAPLGTAMRGTDGANTTVPDAAGTAATPANVATALTDIHLDHLLAATYDPAAKPGAADALLNEIVENDGGVSRFTQNALEQGPGGGDATEAKQDTIISHVDGLSGNVMRGTDGANTTTPPTAAANRAEMDANSTQLAAIVEDTGTTLPALIAALDPAASSTINGQGNVGDYKSDATVIIKWDTKGVAATSPGDVRIYFNGGTEEITVPTGVTDTRAFDGLTGVNHLTIDLSANSAYRKDRDYGAVLVGMVIGGQTVNVILGTWSIEKRNQGAGFIKDS